MDSQFIKKFAQIKKNIEIMKPLDFKIGTKLEITFEIITSLVQLFIFITDKLDKRFIEIYPEATLNH